MRRDALLHKELQRFIVDGKLFMLLQPFPARGMELVEDGWGVGEIHPDS